MYTNAGRTEKEVEGETESTNSALVHWSANQSDDIEKANAIILSRCHDDRIGRVLQRETSFVRLDGIHPTDWAKGRTRASKKERRSERH